MNRITAMCIDAAISAIFLVPLFQILNKYYFQNKTRTFWYTLFAIYLSGMYAVVGLPDIRYVRFDPNYNITPFAYMFSDLTNSILNVFLFLPLGCFLTVFWSYYDKFYRTLLFGLSMSVLIEALQIFTFRASDINDLITNTVGSLVGWFFGRIIRFYCGKLYSENNHNEIYIICIITFIVMFFLQPFPANLIFEYLL